MVKNARCEEKDAGVNRVPVRQLFANVYDETGIVYPHLRRVVDLWWGVGLPIHTQRVALSGAGEQAL